MDTNTGDERFRTKIAGCPKRGTTTTNKNKNMHIRFSIIEENIYEEAKQNFSSILVSAGESNVSRISLADTKTLQPILEQECSPDNIYVVVMLVGFEDNVPFVYSSDEEDMSFKVNVKTSTKHTFTFKDRNRTSLGSIVLLAEVYTPGSQTTSKKIAEAVNTPLIDNEEPSVVSDRLNASEIPPEAMSADKVFGSNYDYISLSLGNGNGEVIIGTESYIHQDSLPQNSSGIAGNTSLTLHSNQKSQPAIIPKESKKTEQARPESAHGKGYKFVERPKATAEILQLDSASESNASVNEEFMNQHKLPRGLDSHIYSTLKKNPELVYRKERLQSPQFPESNGVYEGTWLEVQKHGWGIYTWDDGRVYKGSWSRDRIEGFGTYTWPELNDSIEPTGAEKAEKLSTGELNFLEGGKYEGNWKSGQMHGSGKYTWKTGAFFEGQWKGNHIHGKGKFILHDGAILEGNFVNDRMDGYGSKVFRDGSLYEGEWKCGVYHGKGKFTWANRSFYEGEWDSNKMHGHGIMVKYTADGKVSSFEGYWFYGKRHGEGKQLNIDGSTLEGVWEDDESTSGTYKTPEGEIFSF